MLDDDLFKKKKKKVTVMRSFLGEELPLTDFALHSLTVSDSEY